VSFRVVAATVCDWAALREQNPAAHLLHIPFAGHEAIKAQPDILWAAIQTFHKP